MVKDFKDPRILEYVKEYQQSKSQSAFEWLLNWFGGLIRSTSKKYTYNVNEDLDSEATLGFLKAVETFDATKGSEFSSYAVMCMKYAIFDALTSNSSVHVSKKDKLDALSIKKYEDAYYQDCGIYPTIDELLEQFPNLTKGKIVELKSALNPVVSLDAQIDDDSSITLGDTISDTPQEKELSEKDQYTLDNINRCGLTDEEKDIILKLIGLDNVTRSQVVKEIASERKVSPSRINQIHRSGIVKIKVNGKK